MVDLPSILLIESDTTALAQRIASLKRAGYTAFGATGGKEGLAKAYREAPRLIILDSALTNPTSEDVVRQLRANARTAAVKIALLSPSLKPGDILAWMQIGVNEYLIQRPEDEGCEEFVERVQTILPGATPQPRPVTRPLAEGQLITFLSAKGGIGTSSLCANLAHQWAGQVAPKRVAVVDLVLPIGSLSQIVGVTTPLTIVEASRLPSTDWAPAALRQALLFVPEWQFYLLPGAANPQAAQTLAVERLEPLFLALRQAFDYVLVDFGCALSRVSLPLVRQSARIVMVLSSDVTAARLTQITLTYLEQQGIHRTHIYPILNRAVGLEGLSRTELEQELSLKIAGVVPHTSEGFSLANNQHHPFAAKYPEASATFALHELAASLRRQLEEPAGDSEPPPLANKSSATGRLGAAAAGR